MPSKYPDELSERAVRMVLDHEHEYGSRWEAICAYRKMRAAPSFRHSETMPMIDGRESEFRAGDGDHPTRRPTAQILV